MAKIDLNIDVKRAGRVGPALRRGLEEGLEESGEWMLDQGEGRAKDVVMLTDRVWRKRVKNGFLTSGISISDSRWNGRILNQAPHSEIVEKGLAPAGEIVGANPSVQDIIPWVDDKITPNASAQRAATHANVSNWDPELQSLAATYGIATVISAFNIRKHLEENGYPGIRFMEQAESYLKQISPMNVKQKVEKEMQRELRKAGLS